MTAAYNVVMDNPQPQRRLWPFVVTGVATAAVAFATAGAAVSNDGDPASGKAGEPKVTPAIVLPG